MCISKTLLIKCAIANFEKRENIHASIFVVSKNYSY